MPRNKSQQNLSGKLLRLSFAFSPIFDNLTFFTYLNFYGKCFFGHFQSLISKCHTHTETLPPILAVKKFFLEVNKRNEKVQFNRKTLFLDF